MPEDLTKPVRDGAGEYFPKGLLAVLTPQANTTAEPELSILMPPGFSMATARLVSSKATMDARLEDYVARQAATLDRFANAPIAAAIFACTGAAYLVDPDVEEQQRHEIESKRGYPFVTAANAVADALTALGSKRVGLISPYGDPLHDRALEYWERRGIKPVATRRIAGDAKAFHPIYATKSDTSSRAMDDLNLGDLDAVLFLGTGLPTLPLIARHAGEPVPILSPNLCLMWRAHMAVTGGQPDAASLMPWLRGTPWVSRFRERTMRSDA